MIREKVPRRKHSKRLSRLLTLIVVLSKRSLGQMTQESRYCGLGKPYTLEMCIMEVDEMDIISINKTVAKESKQMKAKAFVFVVTLKRSVLNGSTMSRFKTFYNFSYEEEVTVSFISF